MLRNAFLELLTGSLTRRQFVTRLAQLGVGATAAAQLAEAVAADEGTRASVPLTNVTGGDVTCETLKLWDVEYVFGNTGAYEAGFVDALVDRPDIHYVLGLHEGPVMAMADGYARASGKTAFVNIHSITGTANALGLIVNAFADSSPVVVSVGLSSASGDNLGVFTETNKLETVPELYTKLSFRAGNPANLAESLRRAFRLASTLPSGPVFVGVPADVWSGNVERADLIPVARSLSTSRIPPPADQVSGAVDALIAADNPQLIAGAELPRWGGLATLAELSNRLGAAVSGDTAASRSSMGFPSAHPHYLGAMRRAIDSEHPFDVVLIAGASRLSLARGGHPLIPRDAKIIEMGLREDHLARNYPADQLIYAHAGATLEHILAEVERRPPSAEVVARRSGWARALKERRQQSLAARLAAVHDSTPIAPERVASELDRALPADTLVVTEGVSSDAPIWDYVQFDQPGGGREHMISSGGSLGWGLGAAMGAKLGAPGRPVACLLGDGSYQFAVQALWTAKRFEIPMIVVIFNNLGYQANRWALAGLGGRAAATGRFIGISLDDPRIDHVGIARAYGHDGERVEDPAEIAPALTRALAAERRGALYVLDVVVDQRGGGAGATWYEKHRPDFGG